MSKKVKIIILVLFLYLFGIFSGCAIKTHQMKNNIEIESGDQIVSGDTYLYTKENVNVRVAPNLDADIKTILPKNSAVIKVELDENLWQIIRISGDDVSGEYYVYKEFLSETPIIEETNSGDTSGEQIQEIEEPKQEVETKTVSTSKQNNNNNNKIEENGDNNDNFLGYFTITYYCPCTKCCGKYANGITASGKTATAGRTIAASSQYKFGTQMSINGHVYTVEDRGGAIKGNKIDIYVDSHSEALKLGKQTKVPVYLVQ